MDAATRHSPAAAGLALLLALGAAGAAGGGADWPMAGGGPGRRGRAAARFPSPTLGRAWSHASSGPAVAATTQWGPMVFVAGPDGALCALDGASGEELWRDAAGPPLAAAPAYAVMGGRVLVFAARTDGSIAALDPRPALPQGAARRAWRAASGPAASGAEAVGFADLAVGQAGGEPRVFCAAWPRGGGRAELMALDGRSGAVRWRRPLGSGPVAGLCLGAAGETPAAFVAFEHEVGRGARALLAVSAGDGEPLWDGPLPLVEGAAGGPSVAEAGGRRLVVLGGGGGWVHALDARTGERAWRADAGAAVEAAPAVAELDGEPHVVFGTANYEVVACRAATGEEVWRYRTGGRVRASPVVVAVGGEAAVCAVCDDAHAYLLAARDGRFLARYRMGEARREASGAPAAPAAAVLGRRPTLLVPWEGRLAALGPTGRDARAEPPSPWADWAMFGGGPARRGQSAVALPSQTLGVAWATPPPTTLFTYIEGTPYFSSPSAATVEGQPMVFIGAYYNTVHAFDGLSGEELWSLNTGDAVSATPTYGLVDGRPMLFVASADRSIYALDPRPGLPADADRRIWQLQTFPWRQTTNPARMANPLLARVGGRPRLFCGVWNNDQSGPRNVQRGEVIAIEPASGLVLWRHVLGTGAVNTPCLGTVGGEPALFVPYEPGAVHALSARDGRELWPRPYAAGEEIHGGLSVARVGGRQLIFLGGRTAWAYCLDAETGETAWETNVGTWVDSTPAFAVVDGRPMVFFGTYTYFVYACDAATGEVLWRYRTRGIVQGSPVVARMGGEPVVCVNSLDDHLYVLGAGDGRFIFRYHLGRFPWTHYLKGRTIWSSCVAATFEGRPMIIAPSYSGVVHAFAVTGEDANVGPPRESFWDALGEAYTVPLVLAVLVVLFFTFRRLRRSARRQARGPAEA